MNVHLTTMTMAVMLAATGCARQTPTATPAAPLQAGPGRHVLDAEGSQQRMSDIVDRLPARISRRDAGQRLSRIDARRVQPVGTAWNPSAFGSFQDAGRISPLGNAGIMNNMNQMDCLSYGSLRFPYAQVAGTDYLQPYVVERNLVPFYVQQTTVAIPKVEHVAVNVQVPTTVDVPTPVTVPKAVAVPRTVMVPKVVHEAATVFEPGVIGVQSTVNVPTTVMTNKTVLEPRVSETYATTTDMPCPPDLAPMTYAR